MTAAALPGPYRPDNPTQRLPWILLIAVLLVLLGLLGLGKILNAPVRHPVKHKPLQAHIYELPASRGAAPVRPTHPSVSHASRPEHAQSRPQAHGKLAQPAKPRHPVAHVSVPHTRAKTSIAIPHPHRTHKAPLARHHLTAPKPRGHNTIRWADLQSQINNTVAQSAGALPQIHDPHTLVARYYIASLLHKLQRIGDMNYPTNLIGVPVIKLVIGVHGELQHLTLLRSSGNKTLDHDAEAIARESAPFAPFPDQLKHQTSSIELVCYMNFEGYRQIYAGY